MLRELPGDRRVVIVANPLLASTLAMASANRSICFATMLAMESGVPRIFTANFIQTFAADMMDTMGHCGENKELPRVDAIRFVNDVVKPLIKTGKHLMFTISFLSANLVLKEQQKPIILKT